MSKLQNQFMLDAHGVSPLILFNVLWLSNCYLLSCGCIVPCILGVKESTTTPFVGWKESWKSGFELVPVLPDSSAFQWSMYSAADSCSVEIDVVLADRTSCFWNFCGNNFVILVWTMKTLFLTFCHLYFTGVRLWFRIYWTTLAEMTFTILQARENKK